MERMIRDLSAVNNGLSYRLHAFSFFITEVCTALKRWKGGFDAFQVVVLLVGW
jgi:hypothetical protein